jgi:hypothetical protein
VYTAESAVSDGRAQKFYWRAAATRFSIRELVAAGSGVWAKLEWK